MSQLQWGAIVIGGQYCLWHYCHICQASGAGRVGRLHSFSNCVKSSDCRRGHQEASEVENGEKAAGWLGPVHSESVPLPQGWDLSSAAAWWVAMDWGPWTESYVPVRWLKPSPQPCWEFLPSNPYLAHWGEWGYHWVLMELLLGQVPPLQCPHNSFLWPGFPFSLQVQGKHGLNSMLCLLNPVLLSAPNKSLNFHKFCTLSNYLKMQIHMCRWLTSEWWGYFLFFLT
jgi:hypothetical protein